MKLVPLVLIQLLLVSCSLHSVSDYTDAPLPLPESFQSDLGSGPELAQWWQEFEDPSLNELIEEAFRENLSLKQAWARLKQAREISVTAEADLYPQIAATGSAEKNDFTERGQGNEVQRFLFQNLYSAGGQLTYELDLWGKIYSRKKAVSLRAYAVRNDAEHTALLLSANIARTWFSIQEQQQLHSILVEQIQTSSTFLKLTELRFSLGQGSAVDVLQQRQQLEATKAELPIVLATLEKNWNQLAVLLGKTTQNIKDKWTPKDLGNLSPLAVSMQPLDLLSSRPDLRAARLRVQAEDYDIAAALAERLPTLSVSLSYTFSALKWADVFNRELQKIAGNVFFPLTDGGKRRAAVRAQEAKLAEALAAYSEACLIAIQEVEDSLVDEGAQEKLLKNLQGQLQISKSLVRETRNRYLNGLSSYLNVIVAVQSMQNLERQVVSTRRNLLAARIKLHQSLGGAWTKDLSESGLIESASKSVSEEEVST